MTQIMLRFTQFENEQAEVLIDTIKKGEESYLHSQVDEEELVKKTHEALGKMSALQTEES